MAVVYKAPPGGRGGLTGTVKLYDSSWAVVIGIDKYRSPNVPGLTGAVRDASTVAGELRKQGFAVTLLLNEQAGRVSVADLLGNGLPGRLHKNDRVLVYFAGHGMTTGEGATALGYLVPADGDRDRIRATGISMTELNLWFADYRCKHVMFVADACYSGLALSTRATGMASTLGDYLLQVTREPVRLVMTAGRSTESAHEWRGQGLFTQFFLAGIKGAADADGDGIVTSDELAAYVKPNVAQTALSYLGAPQNPQVGRNGEGEFVFLTDRRSPKARIPVEATQPVPILVPSASAQRASVRLPGIDGRDGAPMVLIPAGEFQMGSDDGNADEEPIHTVKLDAYYLDKYLVTNERYAAFLNDYGHDKDENGQTMVYENPWSLRRSGSRWEAQPGYANHPVVYETWYGAVQYAKHYGKRLPTEAEWEYACRAGEAGRWCFGDDEGALGDYAWYGANAGGATHPVGKKAPNAWGLFDVHGNAWEWCADWYDGSYYAGSPARNPTGPSSGAGAVMRGGSWVVGAEKCRSATRSGGGVGFWSSGVGFRCAKAAGAGS